MSVLTRILLQIMFQFVILVLLIGDVRGVGRGIVADQQEEDGAESDLQNGAGPCKLGLTGLLAHLEKKLILNTFSNKF